MLNKTAPMKTRDLVMVSLLTALIVVLALVPPIPVPLVPVPVTLQTLGVMLAGLVLGPGRAGLAVLLYVAMAMVGLPVLPGGRAGLAVLMGPTGGFLLGMIPGAMLTGWLSRRIRFGLEAPGRQITLNFFACLLGGVALVYAFGIPWLASVTGMGMTKAALAVLVFVPGDMVKALIAATVAYQVARHIEA